MISIINAAINEHNELSVASYGELVHRVVKLVEGQSAPELLLSELVEKVEGQTGKKLKISRIQKVKVS